MIGSLHGFLTARLKETTMTASPIVQPKIEIHSQSVADRFWPKVNKTDTCWLWTGSIKEKGYGRFFLNKRKVPAHRVAYELVKGPIPEGLQIDHLCRVRHCVNPDHLEAVTCRTNILRGEGVAAQQHRKTHCKRGHPFTSDNTEIVKKNGKPMGRRCIICRKQYYRNYKSKGRS